MLFCKAEVELLGTVIEPEPNEWSNSENAEDVIRSKTNIFFIEQGKSCHIAVSNILYHKKKALLCAAVKKGFFTTQLITAFLKAIDLEAGRIEIEEITLEAYCKMLQFSYRCSYIDDRDDVCEELGIAALDKRRIFRNLYFSETILSDTGTKKELTAKIENLLFANSLHVELERIYQGAQKKITFGHPVHYMLLADNQEVRKQMLHILLTALYQNGRIQSRRYVEIDLEGKLQSRDIEFDFDRNSHSNEKQLKLLYESCAGGTVVVSVASFAEEDSKHARTGADIISKLCNAMWQNRNKTLTVLCFEHNDEKIKNAFMEQLGTFTIVPIAQETVFDDRARDYLRARAKEHSVSPDKALYKSVTDGKGYTTADLVTAFDKWYDERLKSKIYTQYAAFETANKIAVSKPKGTSIENLERMIGLTEAKQVIHQALDFYKAQKLFQAERFSGECPAMHMVFTGNPGTAKTTVARLFAQIMKDNSLLSVGNLYEVGRADLVGKYVGWTAPTVKSKFKAAKGSVLFIDEAYSLVDHKDGLYGDEAINTIVQEMENHREDMAVIFAGYPDKMEKFLQKNPGLRSRIAFHVHFADYNAEELFEITSLLAVQKHISFDSTVKERLLPIFESAINTEDFGNGRFARNLLEKAIMKQATRLVTMDVDSVTKADIETLIADDFNMPVISKPAASKRIGFYNN